MAKKPTPLAGEATTTNYGWVKPTVGSSVDLWGGYINADLDSIDSVVHAIDTRPVGVTVSDTPPANPLVGQEWFDGVSGQLYVWYDDGNSSQWVIAVNATASLLPASTTVLGAVKVDGTTIKAAPDGTISTTVVPMGDNRIINGDMRIDQRFKGVSQGAVNGYLIDRWAYGATTPSLLSGGRSSTVPPGFGYSLWSSSTSAHTQVATDVYFLYQRIEADFVTDFAWGTPNAQPVTLSFWMRSSKTGSFGGSIGNASAATRVYPFLFSIPTANTWTKIVITIPGDTGGTWALTGNADAVQVTFDLGSGTNYQGPANAWADANWLTATGAVSVVATSGANFYLTGVKLEIGSVATPFNRQSLAKSMADCQRYYEADFFDIGFPSYASGSIQRASYLFKVVKRATPTIVLAAGTLTNASAAIVASSSLNSVSLQVTSTAITVFAEAQGNYTASAEL